MKLILSTLLVLTICGVAVPRGNCGCRKASEADRTMWGHIATELSEQRPLRGINGRVRDALGAPLPDALVEVFPDSGDTRTPTSPNQARVAACIVGENGKFCFKGLKPGKYILAVGARGFNITFMSISLEPKSPKSSPKALAITLELGM